MTYEDDSILGHYFIILIRKKSVFYQTVEKWANIILTVLKDLPVQKLWEFEAYNEDGKDQFYIKSQMKRLPARVSVFLGTLILPCQKQAFPSVSTKFWK